MTSAKTIFFLIIVYLCSGVVGPEHEQIYCNVYEDRGFGAKRKIDYRFCNSLIEECCDEGCCIKESPIYNPTETVVKVLVLTSFLVGFMVICCYICIKKPSYSQIPAERPAVSNRSSGSRRNFELSSVNTLGDFSDSTGGTRINNISQRVSPRHNRQTHGQLDDITDSGTNLIRSSNVNITPSAPLSEEIVPLTPPPSYETAVIVPAFNSNDRIPSYEDVTRGKS